MIEHMVGYYDYVLAVIPLTLGGLGAALFAAGVSMLVAVVVASTVTIGVIGHAMFVRSPVTAPAGDAVPDAAGRPAGGDSPSPAAD